MLLNQWVSEARGRGAALARRLLVPPSMVTKMASGEKQVPLDHCPLIQAFTEGQVTCEELRPDKVDYFALIRAQAIDAATPALRRSQETAFRDLPACVQKRVIGGEANKDRRAPAGGA
jgi:DNA-binding transcriptional regulator YdaS (Cro superfamily)